MTKIVNFNRPKKNNGFFGSVMLIALLVMGIGAIAAFNPNKPAEKSYPVSFTVGEWDVVIDALDKSQAAHATVVSIQKAITNQVKPLFEAEQKRLQDSVNKIKPKQ